MASNNGASNAQPTRKIALRPGVYAPMVTIFEQETQHIDLDANKKHAVRLAEAGLVGIVVLGSNGEAVHLTRSERPIIIKTVREALDNAGHTDVPVIAGCSAQSVREAVELTKDAANAGASYAMILPPSYYRPSVTPDMIHSFFTAVADESSIPVLMYNYPGAVAGVDLDSDLMIKIAQHPNVRGAKFTCASTGKITRVAAKTDAITAKSQGSGFLATGGMADIIIQTAVSGGSGVIAGSANVFPKTCVRVWKLWNAGKHEEAMALQTVVANADFVLSKAVVPGTKATLNHYFGYGGIPRKPLPALDGASAQPFIDGIAAAMKVEMSL